MTNFTEAALTAQAQIALMQMQLIVAAEIKPPTPEEIRFNTIEQQLKEMTTRLNLIALTVERFKETFDKWDKATNPEMGWLERQTARNKQLTADHT